MRHPASGNPLRRFAVTPVVDSSGYGTPWRKPFQRLVFILWNTFVPCAIKGLRGLIPKLPKHLHLNISRLVNVNINIPVNWTRNTLASPEIKTDEEEAGPITSAFTEFREAVEAIHALGGQVYISDASLRRNMPERQEDARDSARPSQTIVDNTLLGEDKEQAFLQLKQEYRLLAAPDVVLEVIELARQTDTDVAKVSEVVRKDPAIAAKVLEYANSAYFGVTFESVHRAIVHLGFEPLIGLALGVSLNSRDVPQCDGFDYARYWNEISAAAAAARQLSQLYRKEIKADVAFTAGLLSRVGELAYASALPEVYGRYLQRHDNDADDAFTNGDRLQMALTPTELSARMLADWRMPDYVNIAVLHQEAPNWLSDGTKAATLASILSWARNVARAFTSSRPAPQQQAVREARLAAEQMGVDEPRFGDLFNNAAEAWQMFGRLFDITTQPVTPWPQILESD